MALDSLLLEVLACPQDKGPLLYFAGEDLLYNPRLKTSYPIRDDIPVMLVEEASKVDDSEHARLMAKADAGEASWTSTAARDEPEKGGSGR
jgi:uncharacterized protein